MIERHAPRIAAALALAVVAATLLVGARAAGGADTMGYVSQAYLWLAGDLHLPLTLAADLPWPHPRESLTPLGYREGGGGTIVPTYSPGLPLLMAAARVVGGACAPYVLPALFGGLLVWSTFVLASRVTGNRRAGVIAALLMAASPAFVFNVVTPMSDTGTAALWTASFAALTFGRVRHAGAAGVLAGIAVLVRPNLAPAVLATLLAAELWRDPAIRFGRRSVAVLVGVVPAMVVVALVNARLYGSPLLSGYGPTSHLYSIDFLGTNLRQFSWWLATTEGAVVWPVVLPLVFRGMLDATQRTLAPLVVFAAMIAGAYIFYLPFDAWWYLRFLLPAFPLLFILPARVVANLDRALPRPAIRCAVLLLLLIAIVGRLVPHWPQIERTRLGEERYPAVAHFVDTALPPSAAILSMQHSSSIQFYAGRLTVRYDAFPPARLPMVVEWLQAHGFRPYIILDEWEEPLFRDRFGSASDAGRLDIRVLAEWKTAGIVRVYDPLEPRTQGPRPFEIVPRRSRECPGPHPNWRRVARALSR